MRRRRAGNVRGDADAAARALCGGPRACLLARRDLCAGRRPGAAMRDAERAVRDRDPYLVGLRIDFRFADLRQAPDFQRLALSVGGG